MADRSRDEAVDSLTFLLQEARVKYADNHGCCAPAARRVIP